jgi:methyl-accepting chemotaxis protein
MNELSEPGSGSLSGVCTDRRPDSAPDRAELFSCIQAIEALATATEDDFLQIGSRLRDFYALSSSITELASSVTNIMSGADISDAIDGLKSLLDKMGGYLDRSEYATSEGTAKFRKTANIIDDIHIHLEELNSITRLLRTLGLSNAIQNALLQRPDEGIRLLGENVKSLSDIISEKSHDLTCNTRSLLIYLQDTLSKLAALDTVRRNKAETMMKTTSAGIGLLSERYALAAETAGRIPDVSAEISRGIDNVVTSLQFHDITRQQFEESKTAFTTMVETLDEANAAMESGPPADNETARRNIFGVTVDFCGAQSASLRGAREQFTSALRKVNDSLFGIAADIGTVLRLAGEISGAAASADGTFLSSIREALSSVSSALSTLSENAAVGRELSAAAEHVQKSVAEMEGFISEIDGIGEDIELVALNASVKASLIGVEGKSLSVIAESIQRVSAETQNHTAAISELMRSIVSLTLELSKDVAAETSGRSALITMSEDIKRLVTSLYGVNERIVCSLAEVNKKCNRLSMEIEEVTAGITVDRMVEDATGRILDALQKVSRSAREAAPAGWTCTATADSLSGQEVPEETQMQAQGTGEKGITGRDSHDFGENVELF